MSAETSLGDVVEPVLAASGLELWDVELAAGVLRILVDRPGGVDLDTLGAVAQTLSAALDGHNELVPPGRYHLEVSSPGVERTLRTPEQYRRFIGAEVSVKTTEAIAGSRRFSGILVAAGDLGVSIDTGSVVNLGYDQIQRARTVLIWGPAPKPGKSGPRSPRGAAADRARAAARTPAAQTAGVHTHSPASTKDAS